MPGRERSGGAVSGLGRNTTQRSVGDCFVQHKRQEFEVHFIKRELF